MIQHDAPARSSSSPLGSRARREARALVGAAIPAVAAVATHVEDLRLVEIACCGLYCISCWVCLGSWVVDLLGVVVGIKERSDRGEQGVSAKQPCVRRPVDAVQRFVLGAAVEENRFAALLHATHGRGNEVSHGDVSAERSADDKGARV